MDLYLECNDQGMTEKEFTSSFCQYCRNTRCERAGWSKTSWEDRIGSQMDRLILNPNIHGQSESERWADLPDFMIPQQTIEIWGSPSPKVELADLLNIPEPEIEPEPEIGTQPEPEIRTQPEPDTQDALKAQESALKEVEMSRPTTPSLSPPRRVNTSSKEIYIGGDPPPKPAQEIHDPWSSKPAIKVGGTFKMGG